MEENASLCAENYSICTNLKKKKEVYKSRRGFSCLLVVSTHLPSSVSERQFKQSRTPQLLCYHGFCSYCFMKTISLQEQSSTTVFSNQFPLICCPLNLHRGQLTRDLLIAQVLSLAKDPSTTEGCLIANQPFIAAMRLIPIQGINEGLAYTLERSTSVSKI